MKPVSMRVSNLCKHYAVRGSGLLGPRRTVRAVDGVSFEVQRGEILAIVGESGCGKSTLAKVLLGLTLRTSGDIDFLGRPYGDIHSEEFRQLRRSIQMVFQDPYSSLNPRRTVFDSIAEPMRNFGLFSDEKEIAAEVERLLRVVGLGGHVARRYPHEFSGGQRQRICIARALACRPELLVCDEAVSALDVSIKAQIINLLMDINRERDISIIFISHDLGIVECIADRVIVMYMGMIVESGLARDVFHDPQHPYTKALLASVPVVDSASRGPRKPLAGEVPSNSALIKGCRFYSRCPVRMPACQQDEPMLLPVSDSHNAACLRVSNAGLQHDHS